MTVFNKFDHSNYKNVDRISWKRQHNRHAELLLKLNSKLPDERKKTCTASFQFYKRINLSFKIETVFIVVHVIFDLKAKMSWLEYRNGVLHAEDVRVQTLADRFATPLYVYSKAGIEQNLKAYQEAMEVGFTKYTIK